MTPPDRRIEDRAVLRAQIAGAARVLSPLWPIGTFVAVTVVRIAAPAAGRRHGATAYARLVDLGSVRLVAPPPRRRPGRGLRPPPPLRSAARVPA